LTVYLLDHDQETAQRLKDLAAESGLVRKVHRFTGTASLMESCRSECPDLVLIRLGNTPFNGLAVAKKVNDIYRGLPVAFISRHSQYAALAWEAGASGFLHEPFGAEQFNRLMIQN
jgi:two-component SAPR family response regulator